MTPLEAYRDGREQGRRDMEMVVERLRGALTEIAKEQSGLTAQSVADRFQRIARDALKKPNVID